MDFAKIAAAIESMSRRFWPRLYQRVRPLLPAFAVLLAHKRATNALDRDGARECDTSGASSCESFSARGGTSREIQDSDTPVLDRVLSLFGVVRRKRAAATFHRCVEHEKERERERGGE